MAERVASLSAYAGRLYSLVDDDAMRRISKQAGYAGRAAALDAVVEKLGSDRAMSNFRNGRVRLGAGFELVPASTKVIINHRPAGPWNLADRGRKRAGPIYPRRGSGRYKGTKVRTDKLLNTPAGPRYRSNYTAAGRGTGVFKRAAALERAEIPEAAFKQLQAEIRAVVGQGASFAKFLM